MTRPARLHGQRILVVEDSFLIAMEIADAIEAEGGTVVGPVARLAPAREAARREPLDGAVLDVRLEDELTDGLAGELVARGVPVVLATGFDAPTLPAGLRGLPRLRKPFTRNAVLTALAAVLKRL